MGFEGLVKVAELTGQARQLAGEARGVREVGADSLARRVDLAKDVVSQGCRMGKVIVRLEALTSKLPGRAIDSQDEEPRHLSSINLLETRES